MIEKYYQLGTHCETEWDDLNHELTNPGCRCVWVPSRAVQCVDDQTHSCTRGTYLLSDHEADQLRQDPRVRFINIDYKRYPEIYQPPPEELQSSSPELLQRYVDPVKNYRNFDFGALLPPVPNATDVNRSGYQLLRCQQKLDPWIVDQLNPTDVIESNIQQYGTGLGVDVVVADDATWFGHPEFQSNTVLASNTAVTIERPADYVGGNPLPGNGTCDLLDLVLDAPYYIDPDWFDADPAGRLITRWDGTRVPVESVARSWWSDSTQRSAAFRSVGTVSVTNGYTRAYCNGSNTSLSSQGNHGTPCAALAYGRSHGWAYNANKWAFNLYNINGTDIEQGFDIVKIFHANKPVNPALGTKDPTVMSNSWGYRSDKDPDDYPVPKTWYYNFRNLTNVSYTNEIGIPWLSTMGTQGDAGRWKSEMKTNSYTTALDELIASGVIFVVAAGNSNQKQVKSDHPDFNNYITQINGGSLEQSSFTEFGIEVTGTTNRRGFPQQGGFYEENGVRVYPAINIGALDDERKVFMKEQKVGYSDRGNDIDVYAPADGTLAANRGYSPNSARPDTYNGLSVTPTDTRFSGTSAACPVAAGLIATMLEHNRSWTWRDIKTWLQSLDTQDLNVFYYGLESTTPTVNTWADYQSLEGGDARVLYQTASAPLSSLTVSGSIIMKGSITLRS